MKTNILLFILLYVNISISAQENMGMGTTTPHPSAILDVNSNNMGLLLPSMTNTQRNSIPSPAPGLIIYNTTTSQINQYQAGAWRFLLNSDYWVGGGSGWMFNIGDNIGINTAGPQERLDVGGNVRSTGSVILDNASAILQLKSAGINTGFVQLSGDNLRMGTNSGNSAGNTVIRMNGTDRIFIDEPGRLGINESNPTSRLHVNGDTYVVGDAFLSNNGTLRRENSGSAHLLPRFAGVVSANGNILSGTGNFNISKAGPGRFYITGQIAAYSTILATPVVSGRYAAARAAEYNGTAVVDVVDFSTGDFIDTQFSFVIFSP